MSIRLLCNSGASIYYTVYQITNKVNGKIYIGKHQTKNLNDGYMGSGKYIRNAISKHGPAVFEKTILHVFDDEQLMNAKEAELVTPEFCLKESTYNLCSGGQGGFSYLNREFWTPEKRKLHNKHRSSKMPQSHIDWMSANRPLASELGRQRLATNRATNGPYPGPFKGRRHTSESLLKMSQPRPNSTGASNSQFGSKWITDGVSNQKILATDSLPEGWRYGRIKKDK